MFLAALILASSIMLIQLRADALHHARQDLGRLGAAIAEQTARSIQAVNLMLDGIEGDIRAAQVSTPGAFRAEFGTFRRQQDLKRRAATLPQANGFMLTDDNGVTINSSRTWPPPDIVVRDRDYYQFHSTTPGAETFISRPVRNRNDGTWTIYVTRRVEAEDGRFLGLAMAAIDLTYFEQFYAAIARDTEMAVTLLRRDGVVLTSYPQLTEPGREMPAASPWFTSVATGNGGYTGEGQLRPGNRIVVVRMLEAYPLVVDTTVLEWHALAEWRRMVALTGACTGLATLCIVLMLWALLVQIRRLERSKTSLSAQNTQLESNHTLMEQQAAELTANRAQLAERSAALQTTLGNIDQGIMMIDANGTIGFCNDRALKLLSLPRYLATPNATFFDLVAFQAARGDFTAGATNDTGSPGSNPIIMKQPHTYERTRSDGTILEIRSLPLAEGGMVRTYTDITERRRSEEQVHQLAQNDSLTGLLNRRVFTERLETAMVKARAADERVAVLYLDLDGFKRVNDTYGHPAGDTLLVEVARRLQACVRETDTVARMGGDEFAIIQPLPDDRDASQRLAGRLLDSLRAPVEAEDTQFTVGVSIGIAVYPEHALSAPDLLREADVALYRAKAAGKSTWRIFDRAMDRRRTELFFLEQDLGRALADGQLFLEYQPIVDAVSLAPVGFEALVRWHHPSRGLVGPAEFIPLAEASGLIVPIGRWVLQTACAEAASWPEPLHISVNLSPAQFTRADLPTLVAEVLQETGLAPGRLTLEVTEGLLLEDTDQVLQAMTEVRSAGVRFSLDDFGIAYSGLAYLRRFAFDVLKVDKTFVQDAANNHQSRAIVEAVLAIGAAFGMTVIAEGVETAAQLDFLRGMRCKLVQGYLTGRPAPHALVARVASLVA